MDYTHSFLWRKLRERKILASHKRVAAICEDLIAKYRIHPENYSFEPKKRFGTERIIWQYWGQGYDDVPEVVRTCLASVDKYAADYTIVRSPLSIKTS